MQEKPIEPQNRLHAFTRPQRNSASSMMKKHIKRIFLTSVIAMMSFSASGCDVFDSICNMSPLIGCEGDQL